MSPGYSLSCLDCETLTQYKSASWLGWIGLGWLGLGWRAWLFVGLMSFLALVLWRSGSGRNLG